MVIPPSLLACLLLWCYLSDGSSSTAQKPESCQKHSDGGHRGEFLISRGIIFPTSYTQSADAMTYSAKNDDIFIVSYPKSGTTWMQMIVTRILNGSGDMPDVFWSEGLDAVSPQLEKVGKDFVTRVKRPAAIKTHLPVQAIPWNENAKYIVVLRNPKDVSVSYYYQLLATVPSLRGMDFHEYFCNNWITGWIPSGDYFDHVTGWWNRRNQKNVLIMLYEDMKSDLPASIRKIASFLGQEYEAKILADDGLVMEKIAQRSGFTPVQGDIIKSGHAFHILRKGIIGDWQNHYSDEESDFMDRVIDERLNETGLTEFWAKYGITRRN